ncbi:unannotated protein [freshwater metagenome]|uniref:Unannotated protein n=1 Tax=freshwater metagenome TaxID=449393 RepID=A0A6J6H5I7_9ZZZZ
MRTDRGRTSHPSGCSLRHTRRDVQHLRAKRSNKCVDWRGIGNLKTKVTVQGLAIEISGFAVQKRHENAEVFAKVANRLLERHTEHAFDDHLM